MWAKDAAADADLVIVSIPQKNVPDLADGIADARKPGAPVIETNNYCPQQREGGADRDGGGTLVPKPLPIAGSRCVELKHSTP